MKAVCTGAQHHPNVLALHGAVYNVDGGIAIAVFTIPFYCRRSHSDTQ